MPQNWLFSLGETHMIVVLLANNKLNRDNEAQQDSQEQRKVF